MAWNGLVLTVDGQNALNAAQLANSMNIKSVVVGDGQPPDNFRTQKGLVHQLYEITDLKVDVEGNGRCTVTVDIPKVGYDYYFREIGIIVMTDEGEKLYVYDNCTDDAQYIVSTTGAETTRKRIRLTLNISDVAEITVADSGIMYVSYDVFEETKAQMEEGIKNNAENLDGHVKDTGNPHKVSREHLNIEKIDNTADMDKPVSTAQQAALDALYEQLAAYTRQQIANLINGAPSSLDTLKEVADAISAHKTIMDALDAAIGKKASAAEFDSHVKDMTKHVTAAERTGWNGKLAPTGDASNVTATFSQATTRANLSSKEKLSVSLGKIMKWLADLAKGAASTLLGTNLTASRALVANGNGKVAVSSVTATELGYLAGVTSGIQGQLNELNTGISGMLSPIVIVFKDYEIRPTVSNSVVDLNYDISDLILPGYVISQIVDVKVLYTDSYRYQQVTITNLSSQSATAKIMCLNTVPFKIRIYALIYRKSAIAN